MRVLLLGAGGPAAVGVANSLRAAGGYELWGANCDPTALLHSGCDRTLTIRRAPSPSHSAAVLRLSRMVDFFHPQPDEETLALANMQGLLPGKTFLPPYETVRLCQDKWESYKVWKNAGVPVPPTVRVKGRTDLYHMIFPTDKPAREVWLRRRSGAGGAGSLRTKSYEFAIEWLNHHDGWGDFTVAEALSAATVTWQSVWWRGDLVVAQQRQRVSWANARNAVSGVGGSTAVGETCRIPAVDEIAEAAVWAVDQKPHGIFGVDLTLDHSGDPKVTEINCGRFFTTVQFFTELGLNLPDLVVKMVKNNEPPYRGALNPLPIGKRWVRTMDRAPVLV
jgi:glutathione synthase/RimK-type ligase-like ATP-grasp enzyme